MLGAGENVRGIARKLNRDCRKIKKYLNNPSKQRTRKGKGVFKTITGRQMTLIKKELGKNPLSTSKKIFDDAQVVGPSRSTRCKDPQKSWKSTEIKENTMSHQGWKA